MDALPVCLQDGLAKIESRLEARYKEVLTYVGTTNGGSMFRVYLGPETWSVIVVLPSNLACLLAAGEGWEDIGSLVKPGEEY